MFAKLACCSEDGSWATLCNPSSHHGESCNQIPHTFDYIQCKSSITYLSAKSWIRLVPYLLSCCQFQSVPRANISAIFLPFSILALSLKQDHPNTDPDRHSPLPSLLSAPGLPMSPFKTIFFLHCNNRQSNVKFYIPLALCCYGSSWKYH